VRVELDVAVALAFVDESFEAGEFAVSDAYDGSYEVHGVEINTCWIFCGTGSVLRQVRIVGINTFLIFLRQNW